MKPINAELFWSKVARGAESDCWDWRSNIGANGYGQLRHDSKTLSAHRVAWHLATGLDPVGRNVCHRCDRPTCCNPSHLFLGTQQDNLRDRDTKRRQLTPRGSGNGNAKLTLEQVREIRGSSEPARALAEKYGVSRNYIYLVKNKTNWSHI